MKLIKKIACYTLLLTITGQSLCGDSWWSRLTNYLSSWKNSAFATASSTGTWIKENPGKTTLVAGGLTAAGIACYLYKKNCQLQKEPQNKINQFVQSGQLIKLEEENYDFSDNTKKNPEKIGMSIINPIILAIKEEQQRMSNPQFNDNMLELIWAKKDSLLLNEHDLIILKNILNSIIKEKNASPTKIFSIISENIRNDKNSLKYFNEKQYNNLNFFNPQAANGAKNVEQLIHIARNKFDYPENSITLLQLALLNFNYEMKKEYPDAQTTHSLVEQIQALSNEILNSLMKNRVGNTPTLLNF